MRLLAVCFLLVPLALQAHQVSKAARGQQSAKTEPRGSDSAPVAVKLLNTGKSAEDRASDAEQLAEAKRANRWTVTFAIVSAGSTLVLVVIAALQWRTLKAQKATMEGQKATMDKQWVTMAEQEARMRESVTEMRLATRAGEEAARAALIGANAARASADAAVATERAYMLLNVRASDEKNKNRAPLGLGTIRFLVFTNYGKTPAIIEKVFGSFQYWTGATLDSEPRPEGGIAINSGQSLPPFDLKCEATAEEMQRAKVGDGHIVMIGRVEYRDVFGNPHETGFCWRYNFEMNAFTQVQDGKVNYHT